MLTLFVRRYVIHNLRLAHLRNCNEALSASIIDLGESAGGDGPWVRATGGRDVERFVCSACQRLQFACQDLTPSLPYLSLADGQSSKRPTRRPSAPLLPRQEVPLCIINVQTSNGRSLHANLALLPVPTPLQSPTEKVPNCSTRRLSSAPDSPSLVEQATASRAFEQSSTQQRPERDDRARARRVRPSRASPDLKFVDRRRSRRPCHPLKEVRTARDQTRNLSWVPIQALRRPSRRASRPAHREE